MAVRVRVQLDRRAMGDVALRSAGMQALISQRTSVGAGFAANWSGEETFPKVTLGRERWYGTYGVSKLAESKKGAASRSVGVMR